MKLADRYRAAAETPTSINEHLPLFVDFVINLDATSVLELGTASTAWSTTAFLYGLHKTGGHLWSVDLLPAPFTDPAWTHIEGDDLDPYVIVQTPAMVDILFIDTSHEYRHTAQELNVYGPKVRSGGRILLHDTASEPVISQLRSGKQNRNMTDRPDHVVYPVRYAADQYAAAWGYQATYHDNCCGLGVIAIP